MNCKIVFINVLCIVAAFGVQSLTSESELTLTNLANQPENAIGFWPFSNPSDYNSTVLFYLYTKNSIGTPVELWNGDEITLKRSDFKSSRKTTIVIHGYHNNVQSPITQLVKNALLEFEDVNVIAIDWSYFTKNINYLSVVNSVKEVGDFIGDFVNFLMDQTGLSPDKVHLIGHSIGAHASGFAAKNLKSKGRMIARISGLDPAWPGFYTVDSDGRLASTDAKFVDCVHTCSGVLGFPISICQADFYPNGGKNQPGCPWLDFGVCSHGRSFDYYSESINSTHVFEAQTCDSIVDGVPYGCKNEGARMGYFATNEFLGQFYLTTKSTSPYAENVQSSE